MQIFGPYRVNTNISTPSSSQPIQSKPTDPQSNRISNQPVDQLDLSSDLSAVAGEAPTVEGIRFERVADIRRQIADGSYDTDEKLDLALDRLLDEIG